MISVARLPLLVASWLVVGSGAAAIIWVALVRRLNFDESLALRAGWLIVNRLDASPSLYMPFTGILGALSIWIQDPGQLFSALRLMTVFLTGGVLGLMMLRLKMLNAEILIAVGLLLANAAFVAHAIEFRYDLAIFLGWVAAFSLLLRPTSFSSLMLGVIVAWLSVHHLKGLFFAGALYVAVIVVALYPKAGGFFRVELKRFHLGIGAGLTLWIVISAAFGYAPLILDTHIQFFDVSRFTDRTAASTALAGALQRDWAWWVFVLATSLVAIYFRYADSRLWLCIFFGFVPTAFIAFHPHAWRYMLVPILPFAVTLSAWGAVDLYRAVKGRIFNNHLEKIIAPLAIIIGILIWNFSGILFFAVFIFTLVIFLFIGFNYKKLLYFSFVFIIFLFLADFFVDKIRLAEPYERALKSTRSSQLVLLDVLKKEASEGQTVLDPSGLAYFLKPAFPEWYSDTLFADLTDKGLWMNGADISKTDWVVMSYRIRFLPAAMQDQIQREFCPLGNGLMVRAAGGCDLSAERRGRAKIDSYW